MQSAEVGSLNRLLEQFDALDSELQELLTASSASEAQDRVLRSVANLTAAQAAQIHLWDIESRGFVAGPATGTAPEADPIKEHRETIDWALQHHSCVYLPPTAPDETAGLWIVPLVGLQQRVGFVLCWSEHAEKSQTPLMTDLLNRAAQRISGYLEHLLMRFETARLRDMFDNIIECIPHAIVAVDLKERVIEINSNAEFIFGIQRIDALDELLDVAFPAAVVTTFRSLALEALRSRTSRDVEIEHQLDERTKVVLGMTATTLTDRTGEPGGVVYLVRDLRATRELEKLRELDKMKNEFVHMVSHELQTPLTAVAGGVQLMRMCEKDLTEDQRELVDLIEQGSQRLQTLVADILAISRLESGRIQLVQETRELTKTIKTVIKGLVIPRNILMDHSLPNDLPKLKYDEDKVKNILENFLSNAIKYSPKGGTVLTVLERDGNRLTLSVSDQGMGIPESELPHVFDKFHRCENAASSGIEGTGLGLAITKHLIELHGWDVTVRSTVGKGTTFTITIPIPRSRKD